MAAFDLAAQHLRRVAERLDLVAISVRRLAAATDWQTPSARAFFALSRRLAEDVGALGALADSVLGEIALARVRAAVENSRDCR
jgi:hypothetical protein